MRTKGLNNYLSKCLQSQPSSLLKEEIKQSFVDLSSIIVPDFNRKRRITLKEWTNWLQHDCLSEAEDKIFNDNPEHIGWRREFLKYSENEEIIKFSQVEKMGDQKNKRINIFLNSFIGETNKCLQSNLTNCFKANATNFLTWTRFVHWINRLGEQNQINL